VLADGTPRRPALGDLGAQQLGVVIIVVQLLYALVQNDFLIRKLGMRHLKSKIFILIVIRNGQQNAHRQNNQKF